MYPFERFSESAKRVLTLAQGQAERAHRSYIGTEHLVLGMMSDRDGIGGRAMRDLGVDEARLRSDIDTETASAERSTREQVIPTSRVKRVIELSFDEARREGRTYVGTEHLLLAVLAEGKSVGSKVLAAQGVTADGARQAIERVRSSGVEERAQHVRGEAPLAPLTGAAAGFPSERFSAAAQEALALAGQEAQRAHHSYIGTEHLLLGLMRQDWLAGRALKALGVELDIVRTALERVLGRNPRILIQQLVPTTRVGKVIQIAVDDATRDASRFVTTGHLLLGLLSEGEGIAAHVLVDLGVTAERAGTEIARLRREGMEETGGDQPSGAPRLRQLTVEDPKGRAVRVDLILPAGYSDGECDAAMARIRDAIRRGETA